MTYTAIVPYADVTYGDAYHAERLNVAAWTDATVADKLKALKQATDAIDRLNFAGDKADEAQVRQFPRGDDTAVPDDIAKATCELARAFLDDVDPNMELENLGIVTSKLGEFQSTRDTTFAMEHVGAGIPSVQAWALLQPFLRDPKILNMDRS